MRRSSLRWIIPVFLALQLALLWIQGAQLHRQNQVLQGLREDIQALAESIDNGQSSAPAEGEAETVPAGSRQQIPDVVGGLRLPTTWGSKGGRRASAASGRSPLFVEEKKTAVLGVEEEQESATKELQATRESAQKAVKDARETQSKLSIEENIRKADEAKKVQAATNTWQKWVWGAMGLVALALVVRSVLRRRG